MSFFSRYHKKCKVAHLKVGVAAIVVSALFLPYIEPVTSVGDNRFKIYVNGQVMGNVDSVEVADELLKEARRKIVADYDDMLLIEAETQIVGEEIIKGVSDDREIVLNNIVNEYDRSVKATMQRSYTVKIDDYMVVLSSKEDVVALLEAAIYRYDSTHKYHVELFRDETRELPVLVPKVLVTEKEQTDIPVYSSDIIDDGGIYEAMNEVMNSIEIEEELEFDDYVDEITYIDFANKVEIAESYLPKSRITKLDRAIDNVTKDKEAKTTYTVQSGDTLYGITMDLGITLDQLIKLNDSLENENSIIRVGDELTITVPKPELSVAHEEIEHYEGTYEAETQYIYNDSWYTTQQKIIQQPASGYHKAVQKIFYLDGNRQSTETVYEEIVAEAVPKIVEKGTKVPPTYIKPIRGGRITDYYGYRPVTMAGMTAFHGAVDWGTPIGTTVMASCGGTVTQAGWMSGYGYCVFIKHIDGRETRYAHLSSILVSKGQKVSQGEAIALSGNSGVSTGAHLHFEIRINGEMVNPLDYLE